jgi:predicted nucleotidyltransferase
MSEQANRPQPDKRLQTRQVTPELISYITEKIVQALRPRQIILFGSYARGEATTSSDLDLFIIQDGQTSNRDTRRKIERLLWGRHFGLDLIVKTPTEVAHNMADGNPFYTRHIFGEGKVLYERSA